MGLATATRPAADEYLAYYGKYISQVPEDDAIEALEREHGEMIPFLRGLTEAQGALRYAPDKWSIKQVVGHVADAERVFTYRALRFSRADATPLPGFDENDYVKHAAFDERPLAERIDELDALRRSGLAMFRALEEAAWTRRGDANGNPVSVRALAYIIAGHGRHHRAIIQERYLSR